MKRCQECDLIYLEWVPELSRLVKEMAWTEERTRNWERRLQEQPIFARLDQLTLWRTKMFGDATPARGLQAWAPLGPVLDVGCSTGKKFATLPRGYIPHGIEIEASAALKANKLFSERGGYAIHADGVSGLEKFPERYFSGVTLWSYLEHEARPSEALTGVRRVIRDDGVVLVKVPNFACWNRRFYGRKWPGFRHPDHVQYFTPRTLNYIAERAGFTAKFRLYGRIPFNDNMYAILRPRRDERRNAPT